MRVRRRVAAFTFVACALLAGGGAALVRRAPAAAGAVRGEPGPAWALVAAAPVVNVRDAAIAAGAPTPVRVQGTLLALPPLVTAGGDALALQIVEVGGEATSPPAYRRTAPAQLFVTDGDSLVQVAASDADVAYLPQVAAGRVDDAGHLPPDLRAALAPEITGLPREPGTLVRVYTIAARSPVLAHGRLVLEEGVPTLRPLRGATTVVLTTMSVTEVDRERQRSARLGLALGWALIGAGAAGALGAAVVAVRRG